MKRIILDCDLMKYPNSGLYHYCLNLGQYLKKLLEQEEFARLSFYVPESESGSFGPSARCIVEKKSVWNLFRPFLRTCDIWHAPFQSGRIIPDKNKHRRVKVVLTIHDLNVLHEEKSLTELQKNIEHTQSLIDRSDAIVCVSEFTKNDVLKNCNTVNKPVYVIHNGRNELQAPLLQATSYRPRLPFLFGLGYVNRKKNYKVLLSLLTNNEHLELLIAGHPAEPDYIREMEQLAIEWGIGERLKILGPVTEGEKAWYLSNCNAFVHPSLAEGFGFPVIEAMTFGKPVFLSARTSLPEIGGDEAFYFSSFDADHMQQVFYKGMQQYNLNGMSKNIAMRGQQFNWKTSAEKYLEVYRSLY